MPQLRYRSDAQVEPVWQPRDLAAAPDHLVDQGGTEIGAVHRTGAEGTHERHVGAERPAGRAAPPARLVLRVEEQPPDRVFVRRLQDLLGTARAARRRQRVLDLPREFALLALLLAAGVALEDAPDDFPFVRLQRHRQPGDDALLHAVRKLAADRGDLGLRAGDHDRNLWIAIGEVREDGGDLAVVVLHSVVDVTLEPHLRPASLRVPLPDVVLDLGLCVQPVGTQLHDARRARIHQTGDYAR